MVNSEQKRRKETTILSARSNNLSQILKNYGHPNMPLDA